MKIEKNRINIALQNQSQSLEVDQGRRIQVIRVQLVLDQVQDHIQGLFLTQYKT